MEQTQSDHRDFLYYVMKQQDKGDLNLNEVIVNGALFMYASYLIEFLSKSDAL